VLTVEAKANSMVGLFCFLSFGSSSETANPSLRLTLAIYKIT